MLDAAYQTQLTHNPEVTPSASCDVAAAAAAAGPERRGGKREEGGKARGWGETASANESSGEGRR